MQVPGADEIVQSQAKLKEIIRSNVEKSPAEAYFSGYIRQVLVPEVNPHRQPLPVALKNYFHATSRTLWPPAIEFYISWALLEQNHERRMQMLDTLLALVSSVLPSALVCDTVINKLDPAKEQIWREGMTLVKKIMERTDYKSCCMIWKALLNRIDQLPVAVDRTWLPALQATQETVAFILDRNSALIPAYSVYHELHHRYFDSDGEKKPHWCIADSVRQLHMSLVCTANILTVAGLPHMRVVIGASNIASKAWALQHENKDYSFHLKGSLPFSKAITSRQEALLGHILCQPDCRDSLQTMTHLTAIRQNQPILEDLSVQQALVAMEMSEKVDWSQADQRKQVAVLWQQFANNILFHSFHRFINFSQIIQKLGEKLLKLPYRKGRDWLMWCSLQHSSTWTRNNEPLQPQVVLNDFYPQMRLYDILYPETEPLPCPDLRDPLSVVQLSAASLWAHFITRAEGMRSIRPLPIALKNHLELLDELQRKFADGELTVVDDFSLAMLCNASQSYSEGTVKSPIVALADATCVPGSTQPSVPGGCVVRGSTTPLSVETLDSLCLYPKFSLINKIRRQIMAVTESSASDPSQSCVSPAMLETISRLLVLPDFEWVAVKAIFLQILPPATKYSAWTVFQSLLDAISCRVHRHLHTHSTLQLIPNLASAAKTPIPNQLYMSLENVCLRLVQSLGTPDLLRCVQDPKTVQLVFDSEELNRVIVRTLAQTLHVTGCFPESSPPHSTQWLEPVIRTILQLTPQTWPPNELLYFPKALHPYFPPGSQATLPDHKQRLLKRVEDEYRRWRGAGRGSEAELLRQFRETDSSEYLLCVLWRSYLDTNMVQPLFARILERTPAQLQARQLRCFSDVLVYDLTQGNLKTTHTTQQVAMKLSELIWQWQVLPLDRLVFYMVVRKYDDHDGKSCLTMVTLLLMVQPHFKNRLEALKDKAAAFFTQTDWQAAHLSYHQQYPEYFNYEAINHSQQSAASVKAPLPVYYSNVCVRFLPVLDLLIHRYLELGSFAVHPLEAIMDHLSPIYRFHDHPVMYVYTTLHYYEKSLVEWPSLRKKLVSTIIGALQDMKPLQRFFLTDFCDYLLTMGDITWQPSPPYYLRLLTRLTEAIHQPNSSPLLSCCDWRFEEFHSPMTHVVYCTCVEVMALPQTGQVTGKALLDVFMANCAHLSADKEKELWMCADSLGHLLALLPETFRAALREKVLGTVLTLGRVGADASSDWSLFRDQSGGSTPVLVLALLHACWHHCNLGSLVDFMRRIRGDLQPIVQTEAQLLFVFKMLAPFIHRLSLEGPQVIAETVLDFYRLLSTVDQKTPQWVHVDLICDTLYHIKYMYSSDVNKEEVDRTVSSLHLPLQRRLRYMTSSGMVWQSNPGQWPPGSVAGPMPVSVSGAPMMSVK